jgi:preprotein translocase subunit YajC
MNGLILMAWLAFAPSPQPGTTANPTGQLLTQLGMFAILGFMFYMLMIRPQQKKAKDHATLLSTLRAGDKVVTSGGIMGTVVGVKEKTVSIRSADTKLEVLKSSVNEITERSSSSSES